MAKGHKVCKSCNKAVGPRTLVCSCGYKFVISNSKKEDRVGFARPNKPDKTKKFRKPKPINHKILIEDFTSLKHGDIIKCVGGGPIWIKQDGTVENLGYEGQFVVKSLEHDGIHAVGAKHNDKGHAFIFMGADKELKSGTIMKSHKIVLVKGKE